MKEMFPSSWLYDTSGWFVANLIVIAYFVSLWKEQEKGKTFVKMMI